MPTSPQRTLEYNAVTTVLEQARKYNRLETGLEHMTLQNKRVKTTKGEINVPIALSAFRDGDQGPSKVTTTEGVITLRVKDCRRLLT